jgi:tetraacyldisaccharide 4'-kinase
MSKKYLYNVVTDQIKGFIPNVLKVFLYFLSFFYLLVLSVRRFLYKIGVLKIHDLTKPVISVGNITFGGTGKTPAIEYIASYIKNKGKRVIILARGYGSKEIGEDNDESKLLKENLKDIFIVTGSNRVQNAQRFISEDLVDIFLLDDGFQHLRIKRDLDIVVIDALKPFGNGYVIPRGMLREPLRALKRAHIFILARVDLVTDKEIQETKSKLALLNPKALVVEAVHQPVELIDMQTNESVDLNFLRGLEAVSFCGIGSPKSFALTLEKLGVQLKKQFVFMDHHHFNQKDLNKIDRYCTEYRIKNILMTQKDAVKLQDEKWVLSGEKKMYYLKIKMVFPANGEQFFGRIDSLFSH